MVNLGRKIIAVMLLISLTTTIFSGALEIDTLENGVKAPEFILYDIYNGSNIISLDKYNNKLLFIDMMASWCVPCQLSNPTLLSVFEQIDDTSIFDILSIGIDLEDPIDELKKYHEEYNLTWTMTKDHESAINGSQSFHSVYKYSIESTYGVPLFYLVSNGTVVWSEVGWWVDDYGVMYTEIWMYGNITRELYELTGIKVNLQYSFDTKLLSTSETSIGTSETSPANLSIWWFTIGIIPVYSFRRKQ